MLIAFIIRLERDNEIDRKSNDEYEDVIENDSNSENGIVPTIGSPQLGEHDTDSNNELSSPSEIISEKQIITTEDNVYQNPEVNPDRDEVKFCWNCGKRLRRGAKYCPYCGSDLSE